MSKYFRRSLLGSCVLAGALTFAAAPSFAQATDTASASSDAFADIVVTATRQSQVLSRVPISVAAFNQEKVDQQGLRSVDDIMRFTPGVNFTRTSSTGSNLSIRGISSGTGSATTGVYLDDVPIQVRSVGSQPRNVYPNAFDIERVEVLRGPQGTLFGAGAQGGAVRFITPKPNFSRVTGYGRAELAFTEHGAPSYEAGMAVGVPLVEDQLAFRASGYYRRDGGFVDRIPYLSGSPGKKDANSLDTYAGRFALSFRPAEWLTVTPSVYYQKLKSNDINQAWDMLSDAGSGNYVSGNPVQSWNNDRFVLPSLEIEADLGGVTLTSVTSKFVRNEDGQYDYALYDIGTFSTGNPRNPNPWYANPDFKPINFSGNRQDNWTQEIRLASNDTDAPLTWVAGFFLSRSTQSSTQSAINPYLGAFTGRTIEEMFGGISPLPGGINYKEEIEAHDDQEALFGEATLRIVEGLKATVGLRYSWTRFDFVGRVTGPASGSPNGITNQGKSSETPFTPKFGLQYNFDDRNMVYATAAKGFRIGGANRAIPYLDACNEALNSVGLREAPSQYNSDSVWSYEVGAKNSLADGRVRLAASAYIIKWDNIIRSVGGFVGCPYSYITNLGKATSKGFDLELYVTPTDGLNLNLAVGYNKAQFDQSIRATGAIQDLVTKGHTLGGNPWTIQAGGSYDFQAGSLPAYVRTDYTYRSSNQDLVPNRDPNYPNTFDAALFPDPSFHEVRMRAGVRLESGLDLSVFVNNLLDAGPKLGRTHSHRFMPIFTYLATRPRTFGVTGTFRY